MEAEKVLILGATGMLGHTLFTQLLEGKGREVYATARSLGSLSGVFPKMLLERIIEGVEAERLDSIIRVVGEVKPDAVINCIGIIKQSAAAKDPIPSISINALLPHHLAHICRNAGARLIHISTDCVFSGRKGNYTEEDAADPTDLYGRTKLLGEVNYDHCLTLRTSIIGHELMSKLGLVEWFLAEEGETQGYTHAIYSGFPTVEVARIIGEHILPHTDLKGLYHLSSDPISKFDLLKLVAARYGKSIEIAPDVDFHCDRSLKSDLFKSVTGYQPVSWVELVERMYKHYSAAPYYQARSGLS